MTVPSGDLSMNDISTVTGLTPTIDNFFSVSLVGGAGGLMYHNLGMGLSNNLTAKQAIYDPYNLGQNYELSAWYNYSSTGNGANGGGGGMMLNMTFNNNNSSFDVQYSIFLREPGTANSYNVYNYTGWLTNGTSDVQINFDTLLAADTGRFAAGVYTIEMSAFAQQAVGPGSTYPGPPFVVTPSVTASDTDGVGPGTFRNAGAPGTFNDIAPPGPLNQTMIVEGNITGNNGIYINKRTTFTIDFN